MVTALYTHPDCQKHITPSGHPEQVARLDVIEHALSKLSQLDRRPAPLAEDASIQLCHPQSYIDRIQAAIPAQGTCPLDEDTHLSPTSLEAARRGVGGCLAAVDAVLGKDVRNAFVACRPPVHHAERAKPMGFCLFGNVAIAAKHAIQTHNLSRVAIIDFDVHHGNGTQDLLWDDEKTQFFSSHQSPLWPGSGDPTETGVHGQIKNLPLPPGSSGDTMREIYRTHVFPLINAFKPELILISAGFDAHHADPLAQLNWDLSDFIWLTEKICDLADRHCQGRVVSTLEGGYDLTALAASVAAHVQVLMEKSA
ncbi:MAG: histone deacetylase family protein [Thalassovita sp.]